MLNETKDYFYMHKVVQERARIQRTSLWLVEQDGRYLVADAPEDIEAGMRIIGHYSIDGRWHSW